jgi:hypothetical protein
LKTALSWERWVDRYTRKGYQVIAKSSPGMDDIDQLRRDPSGVEHLGIGEIVDFYDGLVRQLLVSSRSQLVAALEKGS